MRRGMTTESGSAYSLKTTGVGGTRAMELQHGARERRVRTNEYWARGGHGTRLINFGRACIDAFEVPPDKQLW